MLPAHGSADPDALESVPAPHKRERVRIGPLAHDPITAVDVVAAIDCGLAAGTGGWLFTPNVDTLRQISRHPQLAELAADANLVVADGQPLVWAAALRGHPVPERVAGSSLVLDACRVAHRHGVSVFLLGGAPGIADAARGRLLEAVPGLVVAGTSSPPFGFEHDEQQLDDIVEVVRASGAGVVICGLPFPKQEMLIARMRTSGDPRWHLGLGAGLSFAAGALDRAPDWMQRNGLEWLFRLVQEPGRLARRYLVHGLPYAARLLLGSLLSRARRCGRPDR